MREIELKESSIAAGSVAMQPRCGVLVQPEAASTVALLPRLSLPPISFGAQGGQKSGRETILALPVRC